MTAPDTRELELSLPAGQQVTALLTPARSTADWLFVYAPGAGSSLRDPFGAFTSQALAPYGIGTLRFQFPYVEAGRRLPDRPPVLEATWMAAIAAAQGLGGRLVVGGRSMGGRIASQVVAQGASVAALALFAYPLHPPGRPDQRRDAHLPRVQAPTLFCSGTVDNFASPDELRALVPDLPHATLHLLEHADHGFKARKATGRTPADIWGEATETLVAWLAATFA